MKFAKARECHGTNHFSLLNAGLWRTGDKCEYRTRTEGWVPGTIIPSYGSGHQGYRVKLGLTGQIREQVTSQQLREPLLPGEVVEVCIVREKSKQNAKEESSADSNTGSDDHHLHPHSNGGSNGSNGRSNGKSNG